MLLTAIVAKYQAEADRRGVPRGNPTGSRFGTCAAAMQQLLYPERTHPEGYPARAIMRFEEGDQVEAWFAKQIHEATGGMWGLQQEPFYFAVPLGGQAEVDEVLRKFREPVGKYSHRLWGTLRPGFTPPRISAAPETDEKTDLFTAPVPAGQRRRPKFRVQGRQQGVKGLVLDPETRTL